MIDEVVSKSEMQRYVIAMREHLAAGNLDAPAAAAARAIGAAEEDPRTAMLSRMPDPANLKQSSGGDAPGMPFIARDPITSLLQSTLDKKFRQAGIVQERHRAPGSVIHVHEHVAREQPEKMAPGDKQFVADVSASVLDQIAAGSHPFNQDPALHEIKSGRPLVIVVGDWGSGTPHAKQVAALMRNHIEQAGERPVAMIHLGDVYLSGLREEYDRNVLAADCWPVSRPQAGVTSWSLDGNHDMYSGAWCYFDYLLAGDPRFANQRSADGRPTSFFRLRTPTWDLVGLDTAWHPNVVRHGEAQGEVGALEDPQATYVATWAQEAEQTGRALMLLSHHQFVSAFDPSLGESIPGPLTLASALKDKLRPALDAGRVRAWLWGHEHRCVGFNAQSAIGIAYPRCIGHGGWPQAPPPGDEVPKGVSFIARQTDTDGNLRLGFAVLDFAEEGSIAVSYYDDHGEASPPAETFTRS